jgi:trimeric autotransporter adhesin
MATLIQIKRGTGTTGPSPDLARESELAYAQDTTNDGTGAKLYIQSVDSNNAAQVHAVGGKFYTDLTDTNAADLAAATAAKTANKLARRDADGSIAADVTGNLTGNASGTASAWATARTVTFGGNGDVLGSFTLDGSSDTPVIELQVTGAEASELKGNVLSDSGLVSILDNGTAEDGSDATFKGDILSNDGLVKILDNGTDGSDATFKGAVTGNVTGDLTGNSAGTHTGAVVGNASTATALATSRNFSASGADVSAVATGFDGTGDVVLDMVLQPTGVTAGTVGSAGAVPILTIDANGRITSTSTATITTAFDIADGVGGTDNVPGGETLTFEGTANEITTAVTNNKVKMSLPTNVTIAGKLTVGADLEVAGSVTSVNTTDLEVTDALIRLGKDNSSNVLDIGFVGQLNDGTDKYTGLYRTAGGNYHLFDTEEDLSTAQTVNRSATGYTVATMVANLTGNVAGNLTGNVTGDVTGDIYASNGAKVLENGDGTNASYTGSLTGGRVSGLSQAINVADGGTGAVSHSVNGIMIGNGTSAMTTINGTVGQIITCDANGVPSFGNLDGGTF